MQGSRSKSEACLWESPQVARPSFESFRSGRSWSSCFLTFLNVSLSSKARSRHACSKRFGFHLKRWHRVCKARGLPCNAGPLPAWAQHQLRIDCRMLTLGTASALRWSLILKVSFLAATCLAAFSAAAASDKQLYVGRKAQLCNRELPWLLLLITIESDDQAHASVKVLLKANPGCRRQLRHKEQGDFIWNARDPYPQGW